jgi:lysophospholipase L1-like esterase
VGFNQTIVTYGTSLTAGGAWVDQLRDYLYEKYPGLVFIVNSGRSGANSRWGLSSIREKVISKKPDCVFIEFAINDAVPDFMLSVHESRQNLLQMIDSIYNDNPRCDIILMTMNPRTTNGVTDEILSNYYNVYKNIAKRKNLLLIDNFESWKKLRSQDKLLFDSYIPDGCHPNANGNLALVFPNIKAIFGE